MCGSQNLTTNIGNLTNNKSMVAKTTESLATALSDPTTLAISLVLVLLILVILVGNFTIFCTIVRTKRLHQSAFFFVASLAFSDFMVGLIVVPFALFLQISIQMNKMSIFDSNLCNVWIFTNAWFSSASILNLSAISWDRYVAIISPLKYNLRMTKKKVRQLLVFVWTSSFCFSILSWTGVRFSYSRIHKCSTEGMDIRYALPIFLVLFGFPLVFLIFANGKIIIAAKKQRKKILAQSNLNRNSNLEDSKLHTSSVGTLTRSTLQRKLESLRMRVEIRTFKLFLIVIGVFVFCWLPFFIHNIITSVKNIYIPDNAKMIFISLTYFNSACNIFIYGFLNKDFRTAIIASAKSRFRARAQSVSSAGRGTLDRNICKENDDNSNGTWNIRELGIDNKGCKSSSLSIGNNSTFDSGIVMVPSGHEHDPLEEESEADEEVYNPKTDEWIFKELEIVNESSSLPSKSVAHSSLPDKSTYTSTTETDRNGKKKGESQLA